MAPLTSEPATGKYNLEKVAPLLAKRGATAFNSTPAIGTEILGVSLAQLSDDELKEVASIIYERGVVFFRDQNDLDVAKQVELGKQFSRVDGTHDGLHIHPYVRGHPDHPEVLIIRTGKREVLGQNGRETAPQGTGWHADVTFEKKPPTFSILRIEQVPDNGGGDTLFLHTGKLYANLPESYQKLLAGLTARHDGRLFAQLAAAEAKKGPGERIFGSQNGAKFPVTEEEWKELDSYHPVVRTHPVTGEQVLFINPAFAKHISGLSKDENDAIFKFVEQQLNTRVEFQVRFKWGRPNSVAIWDNRIVQHSIIHDVYPYDRQGYRVTVAGAEEPYYNPEGATVLTQREQ